MAQGRLLPRLLRPLLEIEHAPPRMQAHPETVPALHLEAMKARGGHAGGGIARHEKPGRQIGAAVSGEVGRDGEGAEVGRLATSHVDGKRRAGEHHGLHRLLEPGGIGRGQLRLADAERGGEPFAAGHDVRDHGHRVTANLLEDEHGEAPATLELEGEGLHLIGEIDGLGDAHDLTGMAALEQRDEATEALIRGIVTHRVPRFRRRAFQASGLRRRRWSFPFKRAKSYAKSPRG